MGARLLIAYNTIFETAHKTLERIPYAQKSHLNGHPEESSLARALIFGLTLHLIPYIVYARSKGSGKTGQMSMTCMSLSCSLMPSVTKSSVLAQRPS